MSALDSIIALNNIIRFSSNHLPLIFKYKLIGRVISLLEKGSQDTHLVNSGIKLIYKVLDLDLGQLLKHHSKEQLLEAIQKAKP